MTKISLTTITVAVLYMTAVMAKKHKDDDEMKGSVAAASVAAPAEASGTDSIVVTACEKNIKVTSQSDFDAIRTCKVFKGIIQIDNIAQTSLRMEGVEQMIGDLLMMNNGALQAFSAPDLQKVDGQIKIENHTVLNRADFPKLTEVKSLAMAVLPALERIEFPAGLSNVRSARIEDTRAPSIDGFKFDTIDSFTLTNNNYMKSFDFNNVKESTGEILVLGNNKNMVFDANKLETVKMATFLNLAQLNLPALTNIKADISFHENEFVSLALDKVTSIGGTITIANNNKLTETSFKNLTLIQGALSIGNNSQLAVIDGFPLLSEIHGTIDLAGNFDSYKLPVLADVRGGMRIQTTSNKLGCPDVERKMKGENIVKGSTWSCTASMKEANMVPTVGQTPSNNSGKVGSGNTGSGSSGSGQQVSSARKYTAMGTEAIITVFGGLMYMLF